MKNDNIKMLDFYNAIKKSFKNKKRQRKALLDSLVDKAKRSGDASYKEYVQARRKTIEDMLKAMDNNSDSDE